MAPLHVAAARVLVDPGKGASWRVRTGRAAPVGDWICQAHGHLPDRAKCDRLIEELQVAGRPLAISRSDHLHHIVHVDDGQEIRWHVERGRFERRWGGRDSDVGMWVDCVSNAAAAPYRDIAAGSCVLRVMLDAASILGARAPDLFVLASALR